MYPQNLPPDAFAMFGTFLCSSNARLNQVPLHYSMRTWSKNLYWIKVQACAYHLKLNRVFTRDFEGGWSPPASFYSCVRIRGARAHCWGTTSSCLCLGMCHLLNSNQTMRSKSPIKPILPCSMRSCSITRFYTKLCPTINIIKGRIECCGLHPASAVR